MKRGKKMFTNTDLLAYFDKDLFEIKQIIKLNLKNRDAVTKNLLDSLSATDGWVFERDFLYFVTKV